MACRIEYTEQQRTVLEQYYKQSRALCVKRREIIAQVIGCSTVQVNTWFQNRWARDKKEAKIQERKLGYCVASDRILGKAHQHPALITSHFDALLFNPEAEVIQFRITQEVVTEKDHAHLRQKKIDAFFEGCPELPDEILDSLVCLVYLPGCKTDFAK